jgi:hypothetical protein
MWLKYLRNFFSHSDATQNIKSKKKLNLNFVTWNLNVLQLNMFQILLQMRVYVSKQVSSWLLLKPNFMFLQLN